MEVSMIILDRYLSADGMRFKICGTVTRGVAHFHGVPHGAVNIANVMLKKVGTQVIPHILLHWRDRWKKTCPETWDICGGHLEANEIIMLDKESWDSQEYIKDLFDKTAEREANEEFCIPSYPNFKFEKEHIKCYGGVGAFEYGFDSPTSTNREYSALYIAFVPENVLTINKQDELEQKVRVEDTVGTSGNPEEREALKLKLVTLDELVLDLSKNPSIFADGIGRIVERVKNEPYTRNELNRFLNSHYHLV